MSLLACDTEQTISIEQEIKETPAPFQNDEPEKMESVAMLKQKNVGEEKAPKLEKNPVNAIKTSSEEEVDSTYNFHDYEDYNAFLQKFVYPSGKVKYADIKANKATMNEIVKEFESNTPQSDWSRNEKLAYWINVYNLYTIKLVVDNYPTSSIKNIAGGKPWDKKFIPIGGKTYSLNNVENDIIRPRFKEPRIHFAVNCASKSCPVLLNKAYKPSKLSAQLTYQTKRFLKDTSKNQFSGNTAKLSKIFSWYKEDFTRNGTVIDFINKYRSEKLNNPKISYLEYSWSLNK